VSVAAAPRARQSRNQKDIASQRRVLSKAEGTQRSQKTKTALRLSESFQMFQSVKKLKISEIDLNGLNVLNGLNKQLRGRRFVLGAELTIWHRAELRFTQFLGSFGGVYNRFHHCTAKAALLEGVNSRDGRASRRRDFVLQLAEVLCAF
jgi:hypothetical protein